MKKTKFDYSMYRPFLLPGIIFLLVFTSAFLLVIPQIRSSWQLRQEMAKEKAKLAQLTQKEAILGGLDLYELEKKNELALRALPVKKQPILVLNSIKVLGESKNLTDFAFNLSPGLVSSAAAGSKVKTSVNEKNEIELFVSFSGNQEQITEFVFDLEKLLPVVKVLSLDIKSEEIDFSQVDLSLISFYLSLPESLGTVESQVVGLSQKEEEAYTKLTDFKASLTVSLESQNQTVNSGKENIFNF